MKKQKVKITEKQKQQSSSLTYKIVETRHNNFDFYIFYICLDGKPLAFSIDSYAKREDCEQTVRKILIV